MKRNLVPVAATVSRQKVEYLMEYLGSNYVDVDVDVANAPPVM